VAPPPPATPVVSSARGGRRGPVALVVAAVVVVVVVLAVAWAAVRWYATSAWSVTAADGVVVIEQGRPGGVLWFDPELVERTEIRVDALTPADRSKVEEGFTAGSLAEARSFVAQLSTTRLASGTGSS
jgi:protein phosphatase